MTIKWRSTQLCTTYWTYESRSGLEVKDALGVILQRILIYFLLWVETSHMNLSSIYFTFKYIHKEFSCKHYLTRARQKLWFPPAHSRLISSNCLVSRTLNTRKWRDTAPRRVCWVHFSLSRQNKLPDRLSDLNECERSQKGERPRQKETLRETDCSVFKIPTPKQSSHYLKHK